MRTRQQPNEQRRKKDLQGRLDALRREAAEAEAQGDPLAQAIALNNIGGAYCDLREWEPALEAYLQAAALVPDSATTDEQVTPWGNAAAIARKLDRWDDAADYSLRVEALATRAGDAEQQNVAAQMIALVRRHYGKKGFAEPLDAAIARLPADLQPHVRRDQLADPTVRGEAE